MLNYFCTNLNNKSNQIAFDVKTRNNTLSRLQNRRPARQATSAPSTQPWATSTVPWTATWNTSSWPRPSATGLRRLEPTATLVHLTTTNVISSRQLSFTRLSSKLLSSLRTGPSRLGLMRGWVMRLGAPETLFKLNNVIKNSWKLRYRLR